MILGYHTAGLMLHDESTAIRELAAIGYRCAVLRPRRGSFDPSSADFANQFHNVRESVTATGMDIILDTNSHFIHDPHRYAEPSLVSDDASQRTLAVNWIKRLIDVTCDLEGSQVLITAGCRETVFTVDDSAQLDRLAEPMGRLLEYGGERGVGVSLCPGNASVIANLARYERLLQWLPSPSKLAPASLGLAADIGEMLASAELPLGDRLARHLDTLACVVMCDVIAGAAGDQRIGHGDVDLRRIRDALASQGYLGAAIIRVEGHEHRGLEVAREAFDLLA